MPGIELVPGLKRVASFRPGNWNGREFTREFVRHLHDNFQKYSVPKGKLPPWYVPFVNINHNDEFRFGKIVKTELDNAGILYLWAENLPKPVADWLDSHMLDERSIEFIEPKLMSNGQLLGFVGPDGEVVRTPVLKCLSLLGNDVPAVKGLPPIPPVTYKMRDTGGIVLKFSSRAGGAMNQELLNQLTQLGYDVSKLPPDTTDEQLQALIAAIQGVFTNPGANNGGNGTGSQTNMSQTGTVAGSQTNMAQTGTGTATLPTQTPATQTAAPALLPALPGLTGQPEQVIMKFFDNMLNPIRQQLNQIAAGSHAAVANVNAINERGRDSQISVFLDRMGRDGKVTPAMRPGVERMLKKCDYLKVSRFSAKLADGRDTGTELDEQMNHIETTFPVVRNHGSPNVTQPGVNGGGPAVRPEVVQRVLNATPEGRAALKSGKK